MESQIWVLLELPSKGGTIENEEEEIRDTICQESSATIVRPRNKIGRFQAGQFISV